MDGLVGWLVADVGVVDARVQALVRHEAILLRVLALDALDVADWIALGQLVYLLLRLCLRLGLGLRGIAPVFRDSLVDLALFVRNRL